MLKKIFLMMVILNVITFANSLSQINDFSAKVKETVIDNKNKKEKTYNLMIEYPWKAYKEMLLPQMNKGEKYIYNGDKKSIYYPLLKNTITEKVSSEDNYILQAIAEIKKGNKSIVLKDKEINSIVLSGGVKVVFSSYKKEGKLKFPSKVEIYQDGVLYSTLTFTDVKINKGINDSYFKIN